MSDTPILKQASDALKPFEPKLLDAFSRVFARKRPPQSMRALAPLAMMFMLEAFGLAFLLDRATVQLAIRAARGPGKGEDDEPQMSILDATKEDVFLGIFVADVSLRAERAPIVECMGQKLDLSACKTIDVATAFAASQGWIVYHDTRGATPGLRLIPRTDGVQTRLRAPLANIVAMYAPDKRDEEIRILHNNLREREALARDRDQQWQSATGASDPEMAAELTAQRVEQIAKLEKQLNAATDAARMALAAVAKDRAVATTCPDSQPELTRRGWIKGEDGLYRPNAGADVPPKPKVVDDREVTTVHPDGTTTIVIDEAQGVGRMIWPDPDNSPNVIECAKTIVAHRHGELVELEFPASPKIFDNVRAWLGFYQFGVRAPTPDATGYCTCAIGPNGEIPPKWTEMKQGKRDSYPGFVLFAPDSSAKVVFCAKESSIGKVGKRRTKGAKL